jgi:hypothetical protein
MRKLIHLLAVFILLGLTFSCSKEDIGPIHDCNCESIENKNGDADCSDTDGDYVEPPITDPNNDEDENKVTRKSTKS